MFNKVDKGADVNLVDRTGASPLHYASLFGEKKRVDEKEKQKEKEEPDPICMVELFLKKVTKKIILQLS